MSVSIKSSQDSDSDLFILDQKQMAITSEKPARLQDVGMHQISVDLKAVTDKSSISNQYQIVIFIEQGETSKDEDSEPE